MLLSPAIAVTETGPMAAPRDPLAVALANASLLGAGYLMLGRRRLAAGTGIVTVVLVTVLVVVARSVWFEAALLLWWAALVVHGWFLAGGRDQLIVVPRQRLVALALTGPVLLAVGLVRFDAGRIERTVAEARHSGDCAQAVTTLDRVALSHRIADAPLTARVEKTTQACQRLRLAEENLTTGDTRGLAAGFDGLGSVLEELPGHERMVDAVLDRFLGGLPVPDPCHTVTITDWLRKRPASDNTLDRSVDVAARIAPAALVGCGDHLMAAKDWGRARSHYQQLLDQYPGNDLTAKAQGGVKQATLAIELATVRSLLLRGSTLTQPAYCSNPAQYSGAAPYGEGTNRALFYGNVYLSKLPAEWLAADAAEAVLVVCAGKADFGTAVRTCLYENKSLPYFPTEVTFHKIAIPVKAYELRTGKLVVDTNVEIGGASCPKTLHYSYYRTDLGPPSKVYVTESDADVHAAFRSLITP